MRVLIVEDEVRLARNVAQVLRQEMSFAVDISTDGQDGRHMAMTNPYDLVILDLMLPKVNGFQILQDLRSRNIDTPVLILTARDQQQDIVKGLNLGSDDYMGKPFDMDELLARCRALIRRTHGKSSSQIEIGELSINTQNHTVMFLGKKYILPALEYRLLEYLAMRAGQVVSKTEIIEHLYDFSEENFSNVVEVYISSLRKKFDTGSKHSLIHTMRGQGYLLGDLAK
jgi:DNA-binding response OmpR family regulator